MYQFASFRFSALGFALSMLLATNQASAFSVQKNRKINAVHRILFGTAALSKAEDPLELLDIAYEKGFRRFDLACIWIRRV